MWYIKEAVFVGKHILAKICYYFVKAISVVFSAILFLFKILLCIIGSIGIVVGILGVMLFGFILIVVWIEKNDFSYAFNISGWYMLIAFGIAIGFGILRELGMYFSKLD